MQRAFARTCVGAALCWLASAMSPAVAQTLALVRTIALPGIEGRLDHLAIDLEGRRLFVAALGADRVEVVDLDGVKRIGSIRRLSEPQGLAYLQREYRWPTVMAKLEALLRDAGSR